MMKKTAVTLIAILLCMSCSGCSSEKNEKKTNSEVAEATSDTVEDKGDITQVDETAEEVEIIDDPADGAVVSQSYTTYIEVKAAFLTKLGEALAKNEDTVWDSLSMLGVVSADLDLLPASLLGQEKESVVSGMAFMGGTDIKYGEEGNHYLIEYLNTEGIQCSFDATYNAGADALICTGTKDSRENIYSEYYGTSFGYIAQYYLSDEEGATALYQLSFNEEDGILGIMENVDKPPAFTGNEPVDFIKTCTQWYEITGDTVTALTSSGMDLTFEYDLTPAE